MRRCTSLLNPPTIKDQINSEKSTMSQHDEYLETMQPSLKLLQAQTARLAALTQVNESLLQEATSKLAVADQVIRNLLTAQGKKKKWNAFFRKKNKSEQLLADSIFFDAAFYVTSHKEIIPLEVTPYEHYLNVGVNKGWDPHPLFSTSWYLEKNRDVAQSGMNPLVHFIQHGAKEGRLPHHLFDTALYWAAYPQAASSGLNELEHYLLVGGQAGFRPHWPFDGKAYMDAYAEPPAPAQLPTAPIYNEEQRQPLPAFIDFLYDEFGAEVRTEVVTRMQRFRLPFTSEKIAPNPTEREVSDWIAEIESLSYAIPETAHPDVSIVIPVYNQLAFTLACIHSVLSSKTGYTYEIIVADDRSTDKTSEVFSRGMGRIHHVLAEHNQGFIRNCNNTAKHAKGNHLVLLNNDTIVLPGWLDELIGTLKTSPNIGLVGSKLIYPDGQLQEAGGIIWQDASAWNYGRYDNPRRPEYSYLRETDYVSGASIALPKKIWDEMGGFDEWYDVAYGEDSDLALRIHQSGKRVMLQPLSMLIHFEGISSGTDVTQGVKAYQISNGQKLTQRWLASLSSHRPNGKSPELEKERNIKKRVLVIDQCTPTPDHDAGSLTCLEIMRAFQANGYKVSFIPEDNFLFMPKETKALQRIGIEAVYYPAYQSVIKYLEKHGAEIDIVLIFRNGAASRHLESVRSFCQKAKFIFHTSDLHFVREMRQVELEESGPEQLKAAEKTKKLELSIINSADLSIVHSTYEQEVLAEHAPHANVYVFPWILDPVRCKAKFEARNGIIFLGGYRHLPNVDAVKYFVSEIWPLVRQRLPDAVFYAAGSNPPPELTSLHGINNVVVTGFVENLTDHFERVRISVAPLRYGAGIKGKVAMSMAYGVPVIATTCAAEGMGLIHDQNVLIADTPEEMAKVIFAIYLDEQRWLKLSEESMAFVSRTYGSDLGRHRIREIIELAKLNHSTKHKGSY